MRPLVTISVLIFCVLCQFHVTAQQSSVLRSGSWAKMYVEKPGVYKINADFLRKCGFDPSQVDPTKIKIYGIGSGMLPQAIADERPTDLIEHAIFVDGESDGRFDKSDYILFYAQGPDRSEFSLEVQSFYHQTNLYGKRSYYFLTVTDDDGLRLEASPNLPGTAPTVKEFDDYGFYEKEEVNDLQSGREWYGDRFGISTSELTLNFTIDGIVPSSPMKFVSDVMGQSYTNSSFNIFFNDVLITEQTINPIPNTRYGIKGIDKRDTITLLSSDVSADTRNAQSVKYVFNKGMGASEAYLDYLLFTFKRKLALYGHQTIFTSSISLQNPVSNFQVEKANANVSIWDITNPTLPKSQAFTLTNSTASFSTNTTTLKKFVVFDNSVEAPVFAGNVANQNLRALEPTNLIIVTHPLFLSEALRLKTHRETVNGLSVNVVTTEQIFNEFSGGRHDVTAIRDFTKHNYSKNPTVVKSLLLFGKGSYDYKDRIPGNTNFVPTYESRNSLHPLQTYSSDDYFGFLEDNEGSWSEEPAVNHTMDIGVGRLPVTTLEEAKNVVDKLIAYDTDRKMIGSWRKRIVFVADDGNNDDGFTALHQAQAHQLSKFIETLNPGIDSRRLFIGTYEKTVNPNNSESVPELTDEISRAFDLGAMVINYTGHGNEHQWADEKIFYDADVRELKNDLYPFMVTATCEFGRNDNPREVSSAELIVKQKNGGVIGMVTTARPVNATTNFNLNRAFYEALFTQENGRYLTVGEVFRRTKNNSVSGVSNRNFALLGDPSMTLALPPQRVEITSINTALGSDTLKALSEVVAHGEIRNGSGELMSNFNGTVEVTLFDKEKTFKTIGENDPAFEYKEWANALFRGKASVIDGLFSIRFRLPTNMAQDVNAGRISLYASDPVLGVDAIGSYTSFKIGETEADVVKETTPPSIELFIGDTSFVNGGVTTSDTYLIARIKDNSGINISGYNSDHNLIGFLDHQTVGFVLNDYFVADLDNPSSGWLTYPMRSLPAGPHTITVRASDIFNNDAEASIEFIVTDGEGLVIESFGNYPNPFFDNTTLFFTHNRSGDDLQAQVFIQKATGELVQQYEIGLPASGYHVDVMELGTSGTNKKLSPGLYLARLIVRSLTNGSKNERVTKLIILN
ncbi:MAG TPA: type IX secretion system sortase PorU [Chryseosolibacter sp.]